MKKLSLALFISAIFLGGVLAPSVSHATTTGQTSADVTFTAGTLDITTAMPAINFGTIVLSQDTIVQSATSGTYTTTINDLRGGKSGYKLTVSASPLHATSGDSLKGHNITLANGTATFNGPTQGSAVAPIVTSAITADTLGPDNTPMASDVAIATANTNQGILKWDLNWTPENIKLTVQPGEAKAQSYSTTLNWVLSDAP